jgi:hypothetical protein
LPGKCEGKKTHPQEPAHRFAGEGPGLCQANYCSQASFRFHLASGTKFPQTPLLLASDLRSAASCYRAHSGLSPPSYRPCWAHPRRGGLEPPRLCQNSENRDDAAVYSGVRPHKKQTTLYTKGNRFLHSLPRSSHKNVSGDISGNSGQGFGSMRTAYSTWKRSVP